MKQGALLIESPDDADPCDGDIVNADGDVIYRAVRADEGLAWLFVPHGKHVGVTDHLRIGFDR